MTRTPAGADEALARARELIQPDRLAVADPAARGYVDLIGRVAAPQPTASQRAMNSPVVAAVYERLWRPAGVAALNLYGLTARREREEAADRLRLRGPQRVLDVACGPGNFTAFFGSKLSGDGVAIGFDISRPMIHQAVRDNRNAHTAYVRGDARSLPFDDGTFDSVCCYAALYLVPEPFTVVDELVRVLAPGGRIAIMTSYGSEIAPVHTALSLGAKTIGARVFDRGTFPAIFGAAGLVEITQQTRGLAQYLSAHRP